MIDREAFVSRLILEADTELERGAAYWLQVDGLELARLRAIVRDLASWSEDEAPAPCRSTEWLNWALELAVRAQVESQPWLTDAPGEYR